MPPSAGSMPRIETRPASRVRYPSRISTVVVLPAPFGPSMREHLALGDREVDAPHRVGVAVGLAQPLDLDHRTPRRFVRVVAV